MSRNPGFTQAQVRRAVEAVQSMGLHVAGVTVKPDGSITVEVGQAKSRAKQKELASWDDA